MPRFGRYSASRRRALETSRLTGRSDCSETDPMVPDLGFATRVSSPSPAHGSTDRRGGSQDQNPSTLRHNVWEREMKRLRATIRGLTAVLLALVARAVLDRPTPVIAISIAVALVLLLAARWLTHQGQKLQPPPSTEREHR